jgi:hypothetical protein
MNRPYQSIIKKLDDFNAASGDQQSGDAQTGDARDKIPHISEVEVWTPGHEATVPQHLLALPHPLLEQVSRLIGGSAEITDMALNVAGVVHLAAATVARSVRTNRANCAVLFLGTVARSGAGKNSSKNYVARCLDRAFSLGVISNFSSGSGIFSALKNAPACVMHLDEFGDKLGHGLRDSAGSNVAKGFSDLKEIYSQCDDRLSPAAFSLIALGKKSREEFLRNNSPIHNPHLNLLAVTTPGQLSDAITEASVEGGLINRFLFVSACGQVRENDIFDPGLHCPHSSQIERQTHELELGLCLLQSTHAELAKPQNILDPAIGWLGDPLAFFVIRLALLGFELGRHCHRVRVTLCIPGLGQYLAFTPQGNQQLRIGLGFCQLRHHRFTAVARIGQHLVCVLACVRFDSV